MSLWRYEIKVSDANFSGMLRNFSLIAGKFGHNAPAYDRIRRPRQRSLKRVPRDVTGDVRIGSDAVGRLEVLSAKVTAKVSS